MPRNWKLAPKRKYTPPSWIIEFGGCESKKSYALIFECRLLIWSKVCDWSSSWLVGVEGDESSEVGKNQSIEWQGKSSERTQSGGRFKGEESWNELGFCSSIQCQSSFWISLSALRKELSFNQQVLKGSITILEKINSFLQAYTYYQRINWFTGLSLSFPYFFLVLESAFSQFGSFHYLYFLFLFLPDHLYCVWLF